MTPHEAMFEPESRRSPSARTPMRRSLLVALSAAVLSPAMAAADPPDRLRDLSIEDLGSIKVDTVYSASKFTEKVTDAPSSVTIVTREEIAKFGYRTLSDILRATRGFDVTSPRTERRCGSRSGIVSRAMTRHATHRCRPRLHPFPR